MINPKTWVITLPGTMEPETFSNLSVHDRKVLALGYRHAREVVEIGKERDGLTFGTNEHLYKVVGVRK